MDAIKSALEQIKKDRLTFPTDAAGLLLGLLVFSVAIFALHRALLIDPDTAQERVASFLLGLPRPHHRDDLAHVDPARGAGDHCAADVAADRSVQPLRFDPSRRLTQASD